MRKHLIFLFLAALAVNTIYSQAKGSKVGYIDMEYILENVSSYNEANTQLEEKAQKWKEEIEKKKLEINKIREELNAEKALLTKGLIEERETEIKFLEKELLDYQQRRFGVNGDLMTQKALLVKPIQDQVFTAIQDIAEAKKYDFIFDKSSDLSLLFASERFDISDQVLRVINRAEKREQLTKKQLATEKEKEKNEDTVDDNPADSARQNALEERQAAREKILEERRLAQEKRKQEFEERRQKILEEREAKKSGTISAPAKKEEETSKTEEPDQTAKTDTTSKPQTELKKEDAVKTESVESEKEKARTTAEEAKQKQLEVREKIIEERKKLIEQRKKEIEERKAKILRERDSIRKVREENLKQ